MSLRRSLRRSLATTVAFGVVAPLAATGSSASAVPITPPSDPATSSASAWLLTQQQADGGFDVSGFAGFETPDAVLALAEAAQTGTGWDASLALAGIQGLQNGSAKSPLDALDALVDSGDTTTAAAAARAAKVVALDVVPLGLDPRDFDPSGNSASAVDLVARFQAFQQPDGSYALNAQFNGVLYAAIALNEVGSAVPAGLVAQIRAAQRSDGSWNYAGNQDAGTDGDVDTTATALLALRSAGVFPTDADAAEGIAYLATQQDSSGGFTAFGSPDPNSTAVAMVALSAMHIDTATSAWRTDAGHPASGTYVSPDAWLRSQQQANGRFASPNDSFPPVNTFATSQAVEALARQWYLKNDRSNYLGYLGTVLASPDGTSVPNAGLTEGSSNLGPNPSIATARVTAAHAMLVSQAGREAAAADLFTQAFNRKIDPSGRSYWSGKLVSLTRQQVLARLTGSSEFYRKAGGTIPTFVDAVYQRVLGRKPDTGGRTYWIKKLQGGDAVYHVAASLVTSNEFLRHITTAGYQRIAGRAPTAGELSAGIALLKAQRVEVLLARIAGTREVYDLPTWFD